MYPARFDYHRASSVAQALELLGSKQDAKLLAGGHSLLPMMKLRLAQPANLIDIGGIEELTGIERSGSSVRIGALTTHAEIAASDVLKKACPILAEAAAKIGDPQVRNRGTIGGNLAHADPGSDLPAVVMALDATLHLQSKKGKRTVKASDFFVDLLTTAVGEGEILTAIEVPVARRRRLGLPQVRAPGLGLRGGAARRRSSAPRRQVRERAPVLQRRDRDAARRAGGGRRARRQGARRRGDRRRGQRQADGRRPARRRVRLGRVSRAPGQGVRPARAQAGQGSRVLSKASGASHVDRALPASIDEVSERLRSAHYVPDRGLATSVFLALRLGKPLFLEGEAGVGKTEVAKVLAAVLERPLIRLQCYEGLDLQSAVYEWNYARQILEIRLLEARGEARGEPSARPLHARVPAAPAAARGDRSPPGERCAGPPHRRARPRRRGVRGVPARAALRLPDHDPGARHHPRRAAAGRGHHLEPHARDPRRAQAPLPLPLDRLSRTSRRRSDRAAQGAGRSERLAREVVAFVQELRREELFKRPGVAETLDWIGALLALDQETLSDEIVGDTLGVLLKYQDDVELVRTPASSGCSSAAARPGGVRRGAACLLRPEGGDKLRPLRPAAAVLDGFRPPPPQHGALRPPAARGGRARRHHHAHRGLGRRRPA